MEKNKKILIADDDPGILDSVTMMLEFSGYDVSSTLKGDDLLSVSENFPDLLLLDIWMSGQDGRQICQQLKQKEITRNIPVILISASKDIENSAKLAGADDFLAKPFEMEELISKIEKHLHP